MTSSSSSFIVHSPQSVVLLDHMGDDQTVVNAARCSFGKRKDAQKFHEVGYGFDGSTIVKVSDVDEADIKLINFLAKNGHWTPFGHCSVQFHIRAPFFVARQLGKHQVGLVWNEISRRYVDSEPDFYLPDQWRLRAPSKKQGSLDETISESILTNTEACLQEYKRLLAAGIAPEMARMCLPMNTMTEWYWSGSLYAFARICKLRMDKDAQKETRDIAEMISKCCEKIFPASWKALVSDV